VGSHDDANLFGEVPGRVLISTHSVSGVNELADRFQLLAQPVGRVGYGEGLSIHIGDRTLSWTFEELQEAFEGSIPNVMAGA